MFQIDSGDSGGDVAQQFVDDGIVQVSSLFGKITAVDGGHIACLYLRQIGDIHHTHIHAYPSHNRAQGIMKEYLHLVGQSARESIAVSDGEYGKTTVSLQGSGAAVADTGAGRKGAYRMDPAF